MPRYTQAYLDFVSRIDEIKILLRSAKRKERSDAIRHRGEINVLCRSAIVLLSSHLEGYVKDLGELALDSLHVQGISRANMSSKIFFHISKDFFADMREMTDPEKLADRVFTFLNEDGGFWSKLGPFTNPIPVDKFNKGFSNPAFDKVNSYFKRFGYAFYERDMAKRLKAQLQLLRNTVNHLVDTRNDIAHGNLSATKTPGDVENMLKQIRVYAAATDAVFANWWRDTFCVIR
ncbi:MAE_28990/MAE_18760 family HEPN-like nuclease [Herbaspirillum seropedicae]|uniref:MAE_28990/MAE_18760 family HEPN-like nuclease n=1 Tax=Herbaspirillum seropedicae TaxID=964 RepID=UPI00285D5E71|nr:MAE_28990/MAE_18760 family HEPN-like nuclease [Herbaspirillum seropedicae]MDR6394261.1 hypothetical protein [Herbaspirillum seropedicae]